MVNPNDCADGVIVATNGQTDELVVVPRVFLNGTGILVLVDPENRFDEGFRRILSSLRVTVLPSQGDSSGT